MPDFLEHAPCGVVEFNELGVIGYANATLAQWVGQSALDLLGQKVESLLTIANRIFLQTHFIPLLRLKGQVEEMFLALRSADGVSIPAVASAEIHEEKGATSITCVFLRVPQRRKYEEEILRAKAEAEEALRSNSELQAAKAEAEKRAVELEKLLQEQRGRTAELKRVTEVLSHDIREPVRKIALFTDLIKSQDRIHEPETAEALQKVGDQVVAIEQLLAAIRQFLQAGSSRGPEKINFTQLIRETAALVEMRNGFTDWTLEMTELPDVVAHRQPLQLLFGHLLENSIKFRDPSRKLHIKVSGQMIQQNIFQMTQNQYAYGHFVRYQITDNGVGFDPKYKEYVFGLLKKVDLDSAGFGIGLAICRKVAELHFGSIVVDPMPGEGTQFSLVLPSEV